MAEGQRRPKGWAIRHSVLQSAARQDGSRCRLIWQPLRRLPAAQAAPMRHFCVGLFDRDPADHAVPVVVGAAQVIGAGAVRREEKVFRFAGLHQHLRVFAVENIGVIDRGGGQKCRRGEFVSFLAAILQV